MEDFTDTVFRRVVAQSGRPDLWFTEFLRVDVATWAGETPSRLRFEATERPIIAQVWGRNADEFEPACTAIERLGFDGIDINMGCAVRKILRTGAGAALIGNEPLASGIIAAARRGTSLPISVKTRLADDWAGTSRWCRFLFDQGIAALTVHARRVADTFSGHADWRRIAQIVRIQHAAGTRCAVIGNGDVRNRAHALRLAEHTGVDGVMVGRGAVQNPAFFARLSEVSPASRAERIANLISHARVYRTTWGNRRKVRVFRKYVGSHIHGYPGWRSDTKRLYGAESYEEFFAVAETISREAMT